MTTTEIVQFLKQNIRESPKRILDVCCGDGELVSELSSEYNNSRTYGLDINRKALAYGIAKGNFKKAVPIHGNAYSLLKENPDFSLVSLDTKHCTGYIDWTKLKHKKLKEPVTEFDLVTTVNPAARLSLDGIGSLTSEKPTLCSFVPITVVSWPASRGGKVLYSQEIANRYAGLYGGPTPKTLANEDVETALEMLRVESECVNLEYVNHGLLDSEDRGTIDLAVLFKKL